MKLNLTQQLKIEKDATPGPWYWWMSQNAPIKLGNNDETQIGISVQDTCNAAFIAESRNHYRRLLKIAEAAKRAEYEAVSTMNAEELRRLLEDVEIDDE